MNQRDMKPANPTGRAVSPERAAQLKAEWMLARAQALFAADSSRWTALVKAMERSAECNPPITIFTTTRGLMGHDFGAPDRERVYRNGVLVEER